MHIPDCLGLSRYPDVHSTVLHAILCTSTYNSACSFADCPSSSGFPQQQGIQLGCGGLSESVVSYGCYGSMTLGILERKLVPIVMSETGRAAFESRKGRGHQS